MPQKRKMAALCGAKHFLPVNPADLIDLIPRQGFPVFLTVVDGKSSGKMHRTDQIIQRIFTQFSNDGIDIFEKEINFQPGIKSEIIGIESFFEPFKFGTIFIDP